jgi:DNA-binding MarR family transcriptional regulator
MPDNRKMRPPIPYLLAYAHTIASRLADAELRPHGLTVRQFGLLAQLRAEPELTISELARQLGITRQSLHGMVDELERGGHLVREPGASGRTRRLSLAPGTERLLADAHGPMARAEGEFLRGVPARDREALRSLLQRALAGVTDDEAWL